MLSGNTFCRIGGYLFLHLRVSGPVSKAYWKWKKVVSIKYEYLENSIEMQLKALDLQVIKTKKDTIEWDEHNDVKKV